MTETERKPYVPRHAKKIEGPSVHETEEEITVIETVQEESAEEEIPAALPEGETDDRTISNGKKKLMVLVFILSAVFIFLFFISGNRPENPSDEGDEEIRIPSNPMDPKLRKMWLSNEAINEDYVGQIVFDSGLIDLPFVQARDVYRDDGSLYVFYTKEGQLVEDPSGFSGNDVYIWTNWKTGKYDLYDEGGSAFMDYRNALEDQNLIIYGHHYARDYDPSGSKQFSALDLLLDENNYADNRSLKLILDNEIRSYEVAAVFVIDILKDDEIQVIRTDPKRDLSGNEDPEYDESFYSLIRTLSSYDTGTAIGEDDRLLTLVTCLEHQPQYRQIIVCRETGRELFDG
jgi:hypothetical protein